MSTSQTLSPKAKHLIGVGASIAAGCQPCTLRFADAARKAGACDRGIRFALERGLGVRRSAVAGLDAWSRQVFPSPEADGKLDAELERLGALVSLAAAIAGNAALEVGPRLQVARDLGATEDQLRVAAEIGRSARRGAEKEADSAMGATASARGGAEAPVMSCCGGESEGQTPGDSGCGC